MKKVRGLSDRFKMIASSYPFFVKDGRILLARRKNTGYADGLFSLPAGHVEDGETLVECLVREAKEEVGVEIDTSSVELVVTMHRKEEDIRMDFFFLVNTWQGIPVICERDKCDVLDWYPIQALPDNTAPYIKAAILCWQTGIRYIDRGW